MPYYTAGEFAKRAGITSRTLRHYDTIGLLKPSGYTDSGYRLYSETDMVRLQHILALRYLRFTLPEIQLALENERIFELDVNVGAMWRQNAAQVPKCYIKQTALTENSIQHLKQQMDKMEWPGNPEFDYEVIPAGKLNLTPDDYDVVFASHLFIRSAEIDHVLESCRKIMKPGGRFYCTAVGEDHMKELFQLVHRFEPTVHFYNMDSIGHFSYEVGAEVLGRHFLDVQWHRYENHWQTDDVDVLFEAIWWTYSNVKMVLTGREEELREFIRKEVEKNGPMHITDFAGVFSARL